MGCCQQVKTIPQCERRWFPSAKARLHFFLLVFNRSNPFVCFAKLPCMAEGARQNCARGCRMLKNAVWLDRADHLSRPGRLMSQRFGGSPRSGGPGFSPAEHRPEGTSDNSPALQRWVFRPKTTSPEGTADVSSRRHVPAPQPSLRDSTDSNPFPALKRRAILKCSFGTSATGQRRPKSDLKSL